MDTKDRIVECARRCERALTHQADYADRGYPNSARLCSLDAEDESSFAFALVRLLTRADFL